VIGMSSHGHQEDFRIEMRRYRHPFVCFEGTKLRPRLLARLTMQCTFQRVNSKVNEF